MDAITNKPLANTSLTIESAGAVKTNDDGYFEISHLEPFHYYDLKIEPVGYTSVLLHANAPENEQLIEVDPVSVIVKPLAPGVFVFSNGKYDIIPEIQVYRYALEYGAPGAQPNGLAQSKSGRLTAWYMKTDVISSLPKIPQGAPLVIYSKGISDNKNYYCELAPLFRYEQKTITGDACGSVEQAIIPEGWYLGLKNLTIGEYDEYCYAPLSYTFERRPLDQLGCMNGQDFIIIPTQLEPGKYSLISTEMDWDPNSSYAMINGVTQEITSSVAMFEVIQK